MKTQLLAMQAIPKILFVLRYNYTGENLCWSWLIWTAPWPDEKDLFLKFLKIRNSRNSQNSVWRTNLLPRQAIAKILFLLHSTYTGDTPFQVWFNLDNFLIQSKITIFKIRSHREIRKFSYENPTFWLGKLYQKFFLFYAIITLVKIHAEFDWFGQLLDPMKKTYF